MDTIKADLDWLTEYAGELDQRAEEARSVLTELKGHPLSDEAFGEVGQSLHTPQAYRRAADSLLAQLDRAGTVLSDAATELRKAVRFYQGTDADGAQALTRKMEAPGA